MNGAATITLMLVTRSVTATCMPLRNFVVIVVFAILSIVCYQRAARNRYVATVGDAMNRISSEYVDEVEPRKLFEGAMQGMVDQLDPYSGYSPPEEFLQFREQMDQSFVGIGVFVEIDPQSKRLTIMSPLVGTPAFKAGIKSGDVILAIEGKDTTGMTLKDSTALIKGPAGTKVKLTIQHVGETTPVEMEVERAEIPTESVYGDVRGADGRWVFHLLDKPNIGYIRVHNFGERTASEMLAALDSYKQPGQGVEAVIIDLRGNAGGLLTAATDMCDMFLNEGVIVTTRGRNNVERSRHEATKGIEISPNVPLVVLVDKFSASASEIVAACLQDHGRAVVVGQRSWGKGTVQNIVELEGGRSALRLTIARYWRPSNKNIHKNRDAQEGDDWGVRPSPGLEVNLTSEEFEKWIKARRQRDILSYQQEAQSAAPDSKQENGKQDDKPLAAAPADDEQPPATTLEPAAKDDPQLRKAIEYLEEQLHKSRSTGRA